MIILDAERENELRDTNSPELERYQKSYLRSTRGHVWGVINGQQVDLGCPVSEKDGYWFTDYTVGTINGDTIAQEDAVELLRAYGNVVNMQYNDKLSHDKEKEEKEWATQQAKKNEMDRIRNEKANSKQDAWKKKVADQTPSLLEKLDE